ncbi:MAG: hypothetical protein QOC86_2864 [Gaiellales bacterium]|nr:hypothetical protein [Gaiellales bacterium]
MYEVGLYGSREGWKERLLEPLRRAVDRDRLRLIGPLPPEQRVIEVGAGRGRLVGALRSLGHDAVGIEPSKASSAEAQAQGLPVSALSLEQATFADGEADLVVMWHVLEHLEAPAQALGRARNWLRPGGELVVAVPNLASLQARIGGDRWFHQDVPRHRTHFTGDGLSTLLRRCGLTPTSSRQVMIDQAPLGMWLTLLNRITHDRDVPLRFLKRDLRYERRAEAVRDGAASVVIGIPLVPAAALLELGAALGGRGGAVVVRAGA